MRPRIAALAFAVLVAACHSKDPAWSIAPPADHRGETTIAGETLAVARLTTAPVLDGKLDDPVWTNATVVGPLVDPNGGALVPSSPVAAWARVGFTNEALWLGVVVRDRSPVAAFGREEVDPHVWGKSSGVELILQ